jgi:hypothetical protein
MENSNIENKTSEPHVTVFGEEVGAAKAENAVHPSCGRRCPCGRFDRCRCCGGGFGGVIVLLVGVILILNNFGIVAWEIWGAMAPLWPVLLVIVGLRIVLGRNVVSRAFTDLIALLLIIFVILVGLAHIGSPLLGQMHLPVNLINLIDRLK